MLAHELIKGRAYYQVTYADPGMTVPIVEPMIYIGVNLFDSDAQSSEPVYTFQDAATFFTFGSFVDYKGSARLADEGLLAYSFSEWQLRALEDLRGAARAVAESLQRSLSTKR